MQVLIILAALALTFLLALSLQWALMSVIVGRMAAATARRTTSGPRAEAS